MTTAPQPKPIPTPALLVYGKPTSPDVPQASWFPAEDRPTVAAAAQSLKFSVLEIRTEAEKALIVGVHEGVLKGAGRMIVGSITPEVYKRIEEYVAKASPALVTTAANEEAARAKPSSEQNKNIPSAGGAGSPPAPSGKATPTSPTQAWEKLKEGDRVLAAYWNLEKEAEGWWPAVVARVEKSEIVLNWPDAPHYPAIRRKPRHVAILHPEFVALGE
jgi:hypothetical protein